MTQRYTVQASGPNGRLLRNSLHGETETVTTVTGIATAKKLAGVLLAEYDYGSVSLVDDAELAGAEPASARRRCLAAFDAAATGGNPPVDWHAAKFGAHVGSIVAGQPDAVVRTVREEVANLYIGLEDVLVVVTASGHRLPESQVVVSDWLSGADGDHLRWVVSDGNEGDPGAWYDLMDRYHTELEDTIDGQSWDEIDMSVDRDQLNAWLRLHRPEFLDS